MTSKYSLSVEANERYTSLDQLEKDARTFFLEKGFGTLTEVNVTNIFKNKLNEDFPEYKMLGICNPKLAFTALSLEPTLGVFLPCGVVLRKSNQRYIVEVMKPSGVSCMAEHASELTETFTQAEKLLAEALEKFK